MPKGKYDHSKIRGRKRPEHAIKLQQLAEQGRHPFQRADRGKQAETLKEKYSKGLIVNPMKGKQRPDNIARNKLMNQKLQNNPNWKGGITPINHKIRSSLEYRLWRKSVFERDGYACIWCGQIGGQLHADHIKPFAYFP